MDLKTAVLKCSGEWCAGITWKASSGSIWEGEHEFQFCRIVSTKGWGSMDARNWETTALEGHDVYFKLKTNVQFSPPPASQGAKVTKISFQPEFGAGNVPFPAPPVGWDVDNGKAKGSRLYGWACDLSKNIKAKEPFGHMTSWLGFSSRAAASILSAALHNWFPCLLLMVYSLPVARL